MVEIEQRLMEMEQREAKMVVKRRHAILSRATLLEKGIKIPNPKHFMWTQMKYNYDKHIKQMENWKDIVAEKDWASKTRLVPSFLMGWEALKNRCNVGISKHIFYQRCRYLL